MAVVKMGRRRPLRKIVEEVHSESETRSGRDSSSLSEELDRSVSIQFNIRVFALARSALSNMSRNGFMLVGLDVSRLGYDGVLFPKFVFGWWFGCLD